MGGSDSDSNSDSDSDSENKRDRHILKKVKSIAKSSAKKVLLKEMIKQLNNLGATDATDATITKSNDAIGPYTIYDESISQLVYNDKLQLTSKNIVSSLDMIINGVKVGTGGGNIGTNVAVGSGALLYNVSGLNMTAIGTNALFSSSNGKVKVSDSVQDAMITMSGNYTCTYTNNFSINVPVTFSEPSGPGHTASGYITFKFVMPSGTATNSGGTAISINITDGGSGYVNKPTITVNTPTYYIANGVTYPITQTSTMGTTAIVTEMTSIEIETFATSNTAIGSNAGSNITTGSNNICIGYNAGSELTIESDQIVIGTTGQSVSIGGRDLFDELKKLTTRIKKLEKKIRNHN